MRKDSFTFPKEIHWKRGRYSREIQYHRQRDGKRRCEIKFRSRIPNKRNRKCAPIEIFVWKINRKETKIEEQRPLHRFYSSLWGVRQIDNPTSRFIACGKTQSSEKSPTQTRLMINDENKLSDVYLIKSYSPDCREINRVETLISLKSIRIRKVEFVFFAYFFHEKYIKLEGNSFYKTSSILLMIS